MANDYPQWIRRQVLGAVDYHEEFQRDLRDNMPALTVYKVERAQTPSLPDTLRAAGLSTGRHAPGHQPLLRDELTAHYATIARSTFTRWVRVVDVPTTDVMRQELACLLLHAECGARVRVVTGSQVTQWESGGRLADIVTIGAEVLYQVLHDRNGLVVGAQRIVDRDLVDRWRRLISHLYDAGEDARPFCHRELSRRPPGHPVVPPVPNRRTHNPGPGQAPPDEPTWPFPASSLMRTLATSAPALLTKASSWWGWPGTRFQDCRQLSV